MAPIATPCYDCSIGDEIITAWDEDGNVRRETVVIDVERYVIYYLMAASRFEQ